LQLGILVILMSAVAYAMVAKRASTTIITAPMIFLLVGFLMALSKMLDAEHAEHLLHLVAEISLIILLFIDAAKTDLMSLKSQRQWPMRMLLIGLPLSVGIGILFAIPLFPELPLIIVALIAAILAPTDAALGQAVVSNPTVPQLERQSLTVESGLNDGLALPIILLFASMAAGMESASEHSTNWFLFGGKQIILGPLMGIAAGWMGAHIFLYAEANKLTEPVYEGIAVLALAGIAYIAASLVGGNGFIAAFVAGLVFGNSVKGHCRFIYEFTESEGQMLIWVSFLFIGLGLLPEAIDNLTLPVTIYILLSLFVVRPLAIYISLLGTQSKSVTRLFFGWFGPRGLATALFALLVTKEIDHQYAHDVLVVAINAVWISALLHGISAVPGANWYAKQAEKNKRV